MKICKQCVNPIKCSSMRYCIQKRSTPYEKAKLGKIQRTIHEEKQKALKRDGYRCIYCKSHYQLEFHHIYFHSGERVYDSTRNDYRRGVTLCHRCHMLLTEGNRTIDHAARLYLTYQNHGEI